MAMNARIAILLLALPGIAYAQAATEAGLGAARAATTTAPVGKSIADALNNMTRALEKAISTDTKHAESTLTAAPAQKAAKPQVTSAVKVEPKPKPEVTYEDPAGIRKDMDAAEVLERFGPPALTLTTGPGEEVFSYTRKDTALDVTMRNGKVAVVRRADGTE